MNAQKANNRITAGYGSLLCRDCNPIRFDNPLKQVSKSCQLRRPMWLRRFQFSSQTSTKRGAWPTWSSRSTFLGPNISDQLISTVSSFSYWIGKTSKNLLNVRDIDHRNYTHMMSNARIDNAYLFVIASFTSLSYNLMQRKYDNESHN